jgi:hypothetical protein
MHLAANYITAVLVGRGAEYAHLWIRGAMGAPVVITVVIYHGFGWLRYLKYCPISAIDAGWACATGDGGVGRGYFLIGVRVRAESTSHAALVSMPITS